MFSFYVGQAGLKLPALLPQPPNAGFTAVSGPPATFCAAAAAASGAAELVSGLRHGDLLILLP